MADGPTAKAGVAGAAGEVIGRGRAGGRADDGAGAGLGAGGGVSATAGRGPGRGIGRGRPGGAARGAGKGRIGGAVAPGAGNRADAAGVTGYRPVGDGERDQPGVVSPGGAVPRVVGPSAVGCPGSSRVQRYVVAATDRADPPANPPLTAISVTGRAGHDGKIGREGGGPLATLGSPRRNHSSGCRCIPRHAIGSARRKSRRPARLRVGQWRAGSR